MLPLSEELSHDQIAQIFGLIRQQTRSATAVLGRILDEAGGGEPVALYPAAGLEAVGPDLYRAPGWQAGSPPIYLSHSAADRDAAIVRPLGWRDPAGDGATLQDLLFDTPAIPTGGYALARLGERDMVLFLDHLATQQLDASEVAMSLVSARVAGELRGVDRRPAGEPLPIAPVPADLAETISSFLLQRPTSWSRPHREASACPGWIRDEGAPIAARLDAERCVFVLARGLRSFLGSLPLDVAERLLRTNLGLLDGAIAALRDGAQGSIAILQRLCCADLDGVELERSVSYLERLKISWARDARPALELLGTLERSRLQLATPAEVTESAPAAPAQPRPEELALGPLESGEELRLPVADLLTHAFVCGGSGSGKTIVCKGLIEELAGAGVPSIVIDLKGDLSSLACVPSGAAAEDVAAYAIRLLGDLVARARDEIAASAQRTAELYRGAGIDDEALEAFRDRVEFRILTPRSDAGIPLSLSPLGRLELGSIGENGGIIGNRGLHELVDANLRSLVDHLELSGGDTETLVAVLTQLLESAHRQGLPLNGIEGIETLVRLLFQVNEHTETINFLPTDWAIDQSHAEKYARAMNARLGGTFRYWFDGETLSIDDLVNPSQGRVPVNIVNLSMLPGTRDQAYAIAQINGAIIEWMRRQPGAQRPRLAYFIDEIAQDGGKGAIFPPHPHNPITKPGLTVLLKQGRAFGVSCILATQNAKDIDYKGLGQIDTWIVGRLKTNVDVERLRLGIDAAQAEANQPFGDQIDDALERVAGLSPGQFLIKTRSGGVLAYRQRWIQSLHERMTPEMLRRWARAEELAVDRKVEGAQELWNRGEARTAIERLEGVVSQPYYTRAAEVKLLLCEWLFRTQQWSRVTEYAAALRESVRSRSGFELVHYYEGLANLELQHFARAREALERFVASAAGGSSALGERCRQHLEDLFVIEDDYERLEESIGGGGATARASRVLEFCRTMKSAVSSWPALRGRLDDATVLEEGDSDGPERIRYARKRARSVQAYAAEIHRRLADLDLSAPAIEPLDDEESRQLARVSSRIALDTETQRLRREEVGETLAQAEERIAALDLEEASSLIEGARKLSREAGIAGDEVERVISLYRGVAASQRDSLREWLLGLDPYQFELETASLFRALGYRAHATKPSGDGGVDVWAERNGLRCVIQCKRYRHPVQPAAIRELAASVMGFDADEGIFVTTSRFTDGCHQEAERHQIRLIDLEKLLRLYAETPWEEAGASAPATGREREQVMACLERAEAPLAISELARRAELPLADCRKAIATLVSEGRVVKNGRKRGTRYAIDADR